MKMQKASKELTKNNYINNAEHVANQYAVKSITSAIVVLTIIWILTITEVFMMDKKVTSNCFLLCLIVYFVGLIVCKLCDMSKKWVKYFILLWVITFVTLLSIFLSFHAVMVSLLPIVYTSMYSSKRMNTYTYILTVLSITISVFVGYYAGICDTNMVLLPGTTLESYINADGTFSLNHINDQLVYTLCIFFVLPRCMICAGFALVCSSITKIINMNLKYAEKMENLAEVDGMTGLYNRSKYLDMVSDSYNKEERIAVIFWDINYLKKINDSIGHEAGDRLIVTVAESIRKIITSSDSAYRIGGDEFIMIMRGADEKYVLRKIQDWENALHFLQKNTEFELSVSMGYAFGKGEDLDDIIHRADQMMYENKRIKHKEVESEEKTK